MDLGIQDRNALVCASSKGLGKGCAKALAREGVNVWMNGRTQDTLDKAVEEVKQVANGRVQGICCDITTEEGRSLALEAIDAPDILVNNAGGPPPGQFREWGIPEWTSAVNNNMITPIVLFNKVVDGMIERGFGRIINITSSSVKSPILSLGLSNGARGGLTGFMAGVSRQIAHHNVTVNNILPGAFDTDRLMGGFQYAAEQGHGTLEELIEKGKEPIPAKRFGNPDEFGALCAFLCSLSASYITGQNILIDGGRVPLTH